MDDNHAIISSSIGPEYYVNILSFVDKDQLEPGCSLLTHNKVNPNPIPNPNPNLTLTLTLTLTPTLTLSLTIGACRGQHLSGEPVQLQALRSHGLAHLSLGPITAAMHASHKAAAPKGDWLSSVYFQG